MARTPNWVTLQLAPVLVVAQLAVQVVAKAVARQAETLTTKPTMTPRTCGRGRTSGHSCHGRLQAVQAAVRLLPAVQEDLRLREAQAREVAQAAEGQKKKKGWSAPRLLYPYPQMSAYPRAEMALHL